MALVTDGVRAFAFTCTANYANYYDPPHCTGQSAPAIKAISANVALTAVVQSGTIPPYSSDSSDGWESVAVGPTGLVVVDANGAVWFGLPSAS
jgi:hypothetical protein